MPNSLNITVNDKATPVLMRIMEGLSPAGLTALHQKIGRAIQNACRDHVTLQSANRHSTANRLGAEPTGFLQGAIAELDTPEAVRADAAGVTLSLSHPWFARVSGPVDIAPTNGRSYLSIPIAGESYGKAMIQGGESAFPGGFFFTSKRGNLIFGTREGKELHPLYLMLPEVRQEQDRTRLPSDQELMNAALQVVGEALGMSK